MPLKGLGRQEPVTDDDVKVIRAYLEQFTALPILEGQEVTGLVLSGGVTLPIRHALGRGYRGGWPVGTSTSDTFTVLTPEAAQAAGYDVREFVVAVTPVIVFTDVTVKVWVY